MALNAEKALAILANDGPISKSIKGFETRKEQQSMMKNVIDAYNLNQIALIEAGTGTGKSMAYLIPAILWALEKKERSVISTHTINLQEQLLNKDIPILLKALGLDVKAVIVKGMRNYVCLRKLDELQEMQLLLSLEDKEQLDKLLMVLSSPNEGCRSSLSFQPSPSFWEQVAAENDTCNKNQCPHFQNCHFFKARKEANEAQVLIVNHHLLFADLARRAEINNYEDPAVLPIYTKVILDEAHHIEDIATEYFAEKVSQLDLLRILGRLATEKEGTAQGKLSLLKQKLIGFFKKEPPTKLNGLFENLNIHLPAIRNDLQKLIIEGFNKFFNFVSIAKTAGVKEEQNEHKLRLLAYHYTHPYWSDEVKRQVKELTSIIKKYSQVIYSLENDLKTLNEEILNEQTKGLRFEIEALATRFVLAAEVLDRLVEEETPLNKVRWIEAEMMKTITNVHVADAKLDIAEALVNYLFKKFDSVILCSATLTTNNKFDFAKWRLGLTPFKMENLQLSENIYESPFNYSSQALLVIPEDIVSPLEKGFIEQAAEKIWQAVNASHGNAFVLFTSYTQMHQCVEILHERLSKNHYPVLKQGDYNRQTLLKKFKETNRSVLFGTDSFWEGVDVAGEALRCVIIVKLPFKVPTEPVTEARREAILAKGGDPFFEYSLPNAIVKFKQGFGRLIRTRNDRGCIICLDNRLITKRYGKQFLTSLPACKVIVTKAQDYQSKMQEFYKKTFNPKKMS